MVADGVGANILIVSFERINIECYIQAKTYKAFNRNFKTGIFNADL